MARARNIKPALFKNEVLGVADPLYTLLFEGLWVLADRDGRLENRPLRIKAELFPYRDGLDVPAMLSWLEAREFICCYRVKGAGFIQIVTFHKHQNPHKNEAPSELPGPEQADTQSESLATCSESLGTTRADSLSTDSGFRIPDTSTPAQRPPSQAFDPLGQVLPEWLDAELWAMWVRHRASIKRPIKTLDTFNGCIRSLDKFRRDGISVEDVISHAVGSGNQGLFTPPASKPRQGGPPSSTFRERDADVASARVSELAPMVAAKRTAEVIDVTARTLDRPNLLEDGREVRGGLDAHVGRR